MGAGVVVLLCVAEVSGFLYAIVRYDLYEAFYDTYCNIPLQCNMTAILLCNDILIHNDNVLYVLLVSCPSLDSPSNGTISCSLGDDGVLSYEDTCSFTCTTDYELTGSDTRTCQSNGSWSGSNAMCRRSEWLLMCTLLIGLYPFTKQYNLYKVFCDYFVICSMNSTNSSLLHDSNVTM